MKILVAEDSGASRLLLSHVLKSAGHEVIAEVNGERALEVYQRWQPAVVITDWQMPELDGLQLVQRIRALRSQRYTWIIMLTAREFKTNYALTMGAGVDDYLTKPLDVELLMVRIQVARRVVELSNEVSLLKRVIPVCMSCRSVRDTSEHWMELDQYFRCQTGIDFSHGLCPDCFFERSVLPELERYEASRPVSAGVPAPVDRQAHPELYSDLVNHLKVVGDRLVIMLRSKGLKAGTELQLKLLGRLAVALGDGLLASLASSGPGQLHAAVLRDELDRARLALHPNSAAPERPGP